MTPIPLWVVIPTSNRLDLLERTLSFLAVATLPPDLISVIVVENGQKPAAEPLVKNFSTKLPVQYRFNPKPNKSHALNQILTETADEFVVFFDDDVRIGPGTLVAYAKALAKQPKPAFLGGRCLVDYEEAPPEWLLSYLPPSAIGWGLGDSMVKLQTPDALGFNWGAFALHLREAGGFDERRGPGSTSRGQETDMQQKLLERGVPGYYLPGAIVWHFVPKQRCSREWCLKRIRQTSIGNGIELARKSLPERAKRAVPAALKLAAIRIFLWFMGRHLNETTKFHYQYCHWNHRGLLEGLLAGGSRTPMRYDSTPCRRSQVRS